MPWANFDDQFPTHPKVLPLSDAAFRLHVSGVCYSAAHTTDGLIEAHAVPILAPRFKRSTLLELLRRDQWHALGQGGCGTETCPAEGREGCYRIHDYLEWNRSSETIEAERERKRKAGRKGAEKRWGA
jgi:hypothetical protein